MLSDIGAPRLFGVFVVLAVLAFYAAVVLLRRHRFRRLGARLGGTWKAGRLLAPGTIVGPDFTIQPRTRGAGRRSTYRTSVRVSAPHAPGTYLLRTRFFARFPDWKHALTPGVRRERAFVVTVSFPQYTEASPQERQALLDWLSRGARGPQALHAALKKLRIRELRIDDGAITVDLPGAVSNAERLRATLGLLRGLAAAGP